MKRASIIATLLTLAVLTLMWGNTYAQETAPEVEWYKSFGGGDTEWAQSVHQTSDGGYIMVGSTSGGTFNSYDVYLIKTDAAGNQEWATSFGDTKNQFGYSVQPTADGGYIVVGYYDYYYMPGTNVYLIKVDASGNHEWSGTYGGGSSDIAYSVQQTTDGGYIAAGFTDSYGAGGPSVFLIKWDAQGNQAWSKTFGGTSTDVANSVQQTGDGGYILAGYTNSYGVGGYDVYLIKTDALGNEEWTKTFGGANDDEAKSVRQTTDGGYIVAGYTRSASVGYGGAYLIKTDSSGNEEWSTTFGGVNDSAYSVQQTTGGGYIVAGVTLIAGVSDVYLVKVDALGIEEWSTSFGGSSTDDGYSVQQTADGGYIVAGVTYSYTAGGGDVLLVKFAGPLPKYALTVSTSGSGTVAGSPGGIDCGSDCTESYISGTSITLTAVADAGWSLSGWGGCDSSSGINCYVTVDSDRSVTPTFTQCLGYDMTADGAVDILDVIKLMRVVMGLDNVSK